MDPSVITFARACEVELEVKKWEYSIRYLLVVGIPKFSFRHDGIFDTLMKMAI